MLGASVTWQISLKIIYISYVRAGIVNNPNKMMLALFTKKRNLELKAPTFNRIEISFSKMSQGVYGLKPIMVF